MDFLSEETDEQTTKKSKCQVDDELVVDDDEPVDDESVTSVNQLPREEFLKELEEETSKYHTNTLKTGFQTTDDDNKKNNFYKKLSETVYTSVYYPIVVETVKRRISMFSNKKTKDLITNDNGVKSVYQDKFLKLVKETFGKVNFINEFQTTMEPLLYGIYTSDTLPKTGKGATVIKRLFAQDEWKDELIGNINRTVNGKLHYLQIEWNIRVNDL